MGVQQQLTKPVLSTQLYAAVYGVLQQTRQTSTTIRTVEATSTTVAAKVEMHPPGLEVLVAEDNAINRLYVTSLLTQFGYKHQIATDGLQAVQAIRDHQFSIVLMDCQMPQLDGFEATRCIRIWKRRHPFRSRPHHRPDCQCGQRGRRALLKCGNGPLSQQPI